MTSECGELTRSIRVEPEVQVGWIDDQAGRENGDSMGGRCFKKFR